MIKSAGKGRVVHELTLRQGTPGIAQIVESDAARTLLTIGQALFEFEEAVKKAPRTRLQVALPESFSTGAAASALTDALRRLISYVLLSDADVKVVADRGPYQTAPRGLNQRTDAVCLFSGGVDSISGALLAASQLNVGATFVSHLHQGRVISITRKLAETYLNPVGVTLFEIPAPTMAATGYSQSRGWLYVMAAAAVAIWLKCNRIVVSECGPTMYQPKFGSADQTTMTTHPFVLARAQDAIRAVEPALKISTPFADFTKAEVMAVCPDPSAFPRTHSCISQRTELHDGTCYGCVVRRLAAIATGTPDVRYAANPLTKDSRKSGNLLSLLDFSLNFLVAPDRIPSHQRDAIFIPRKGELFRRFSLDNLAALHRLRTEGKRLAPRVDRIYRDALLTLGVTCLARRLDELAKAKDDPPDVRF